MKIREYLEKIEKHTDVTFIIQRSIKDDHAPFYHNEFQTTPIRTNQEWLEGEGFIDNHIVINQDHPPIDVTGTWVNWYMAGRLKCAVVTTEEDLIRHYGEKQGRDMIAYYNRTVK